MPIFEFVCDQCGKPFEELLRNADAVSSVACPSCGSVQVRKKISSFASKISGGGALSSVSSAAACNTGGT
ncbi:MAG: zinc ribbon domain-containing protein [Chloroflexi bacterium]|nr:zinc ribbon domain-containing protein [Chloroflexota bacterium]